MKILNLAKLYLEPLPGLYRLKQLSPLWAGVLALIGLYGTLQFFRIADGQPLWPGFWVIAVGDPVLAISVAAAKSAFSGSEEHQSKRPYHRSSWFLSVAILVTGINIVLEANNVWHGGPLEREFSLAQVVHSLLVPIYAVHVVGVMPHLALDVRGRWPARLTAFAGIIIYFACFVLDIWKGGLLGG